MDSKKLEMLVTAVDLGSFTKAAEVVGYTQSGLTHMMDSLEKEIGFPLLERGHGGVNLTESGERLMPAIREFLRANAGLDGEILRIRENRRDSIRIAAYASIAMHWLPEIVYQFRREAGSVDVDIRMVDNAIEPFELLAAGKADIIFGSRQEDYLENVDWIPLYKEPVSAILPKNYPINGRSAFPIREFEGQDFLMPYGRFDIDVNRAFAAAGAKVDCRQAHVDDETVIRMVEHGLGVTMMAELMYSGRTDNVLCLPLDPPTVRELGMGLKFPGPVSGSLAKLRDCVLRLIPKLRPEE